MSNNVNSRIITAILWPFGALVSALRNWRQPWAMNVFWVVCIFLGAIQIFHPSGTVLGEGSDAGRYVLELQWMYSSVDTYSQVSRYFYDGDTNDVFCSTLQFLVSRFTDNGHVFFFVLAIIYGFFYSRNIWYILGKISDQRIKGLWVLIALFFLVCPIWNINGVRMWTALHVFCYGALPYLLDGEKKQLIWSAISILIHHSFIFPIALLAGFILVQKKVFKNNNILTGLFLFYLFTLTVKTIDLGALNVALQAYLPGFYDDRIDSYVNEDILNARLERASQNSWHVAFFNDLQYWINQLLIVFSFITIRKFKDKLVDILPLFAFALLIYGFSNILACVPSGGRYITISKMFMGSVYLLVYGKMYSIPHFRKVLPYVLFLLAFSLIFEIRKGLDFYGIGLFGNFITAMLVDDRTPLINLIKFL